MKCRKGRPPFLDTRSVIQTAVEPLQWLLHVLWKCEAKAPINTSHCCWWAKCTVCCLHLGQFPWKVAESRIQNPSWRKMGQRDKRHEKSKKGRTGVNSSVYICAWFVIFLKLLRCICLFAGYKLFPSQASPCRSQILPEALWRFGRGLDFLQVHLGGKKKWKELAPAGGGIIYVVPSWCAIWCPCELHSCNSMKTRDFDMLGEYIFKGYNLFSDFCT